MLKKVPIMPIFFSQQNALFTTTTAKKFTAEDGEQFVGVPFYTFLGFESLQFSVDCPTAPVLPARSRNFTLSHEVRRLRQLACSQ